MKLVVNCETGEQEYVEPSAEDLAQMEIDAAEAAKKIADKLALIEAEKAKREAALAKLAVLGLDEEDIKALGF